MKTTLANSAVALCSLFLLAGLPPLRGAQLASTSGSGYTTGTWVNGATDDSGFGAWVITPDPTALTVIESSTTGSGGDIGLSFGLKPTGSGDFVTAERFFLGGSLSEGQTFSASMVVNFRSGFKGMSLRDKDNADVARLYIADEKYTFNNVVLENQGGGLAEWGYSPNTVLTMSATVSGPDLLVTVTRTGGINSSYSTVLSGKGVDLTNFSLFSGFSDLEPEQTIYFNNINIVPETSALLGLGWASGLLALTWRRRPITSRR
jgi:hypothetical protein